MTIVDRRHSVSEGTAIKAPCRVATTANITLAGEQTVDGVAVVEGDRVLVKSQSAGADNGIYEVSTGNWTRTRDFDGAFDIVKGTVVRVTNGGTNVGYWEVTTANPIEVGTTSIAFAITTNSIAGVSAFVQTLLDEVSAAAFMTAIGSLPADFISTLALMNDAVTYAKFQNVSATNRLLGRATAGAGDVEEITIGAGLLLTGTTLSSAVPIVGRYKRLSIQVSSNTAVTVTADAVVTTNGTTYQTTAVNALVNLALNGAVNRLDAGSLAAATWYAIWIVVKADGTTGAIASLSDTAPALPTGYTHKALVGYVRTAPGSAQLLGTWQTDNLFGYKLGLAQTSVLPIISAGTIGTYSETSPSWGSPSVANFVPTAAYEIELLLTSNLANGTLSALQVAPNTLYGGHANTGSLAPPFDNKNGGLAGTHTLWMMLEGSTIAVAANAAGGGVQCLGCRISL